MDFLLLIFHPVRYFKILRKSENGSKTKMDFFKAGTISCTDHTIVRTVLQITIPDFPHTLSPIYQNFPNLLLTFITISQLLSVGFDTSLPVLDLFFVSKIEFSEKFSR